VVDLVQTVVIMAMLVVLSAVMFLELRYMRARRKRKSGDLDLPDRAHSAILTTRAIRDTLARGGVESLEADEVLREAEAAHRERNYRVSLDLSEKAKGVLREAKRLQQEKGDLSKLDRIPPKGEAEEVTAKERLTKELPPNFVPSRFTMGLARDEIHAAKLQGRDTTEADRLLASAQGLFDAKDYDASLREAVRARRALEETPPEAAAPAPPPPVPSTAGRACASCGVLVAADDTFCRRCGAKAPAPRTCASCGSAVPVDDAFCRKCGAGFPG
jgi:RNA polymerase subunit RPABC4/transcription elongation factor Spt4